MSNTDIKKSFLFKLPPPFVRSLAPPNLLSIPKIIIANICFWNNTFLYKKYINKTYLNSKLLYI